MHVTFAIDYILNEKLDQKRELTQASTEPSFPIDNRLFVSCSMGKVDSVNGSRCGT